MRNPYGSVTTTQTQKAAPVAATVVSSPKQSAILNYRCYDCGRTFPSSQLGPACPSCYKTNCLQIPSTEHLNVPAPILNGQESFGSVLELEPKPRQTQPQSVQHVIGEMLDNSVQRVYTQEVPKLQPGNVAVMTGNGWTQEPVGLAANYPVSPLELGSDRPKHMIIESYAGTGKTFTLVELVYRACGMRRPNIVGSPEQEAIWAAFPETYNPARIYVTSFSRSSTNHLKELCPQNVNVSSIHGLGKRILGYNRIGNGKYGVDKWGKKSWKIMAEKMNCDVNHLFRAYKKPILFAIKKLVSLCKLNLVTLPEGDWRDCIPILQKLVEAHGVTMPEFKAADDQEFVINWTREVYNASHLYTKVIDYDDMVWMPWKLNLSLSPYDVMFVDERQDLNLAQQELVFKMAKRLVMVGDSHQAIFGFAGADTQACSRMEQRLASSPRGMMTLPLTFTRRCPKSHVRFNRTIVPDFNYFEENPEGAIYKEKEQTFLQYVQPGDMVYCRTNAPLFTCCLKLFQSGIPFRTTLKAFFEDTVNLIKSFEASTIADLSLKLEEWKERKLAQAEASNSDNSIVIEDQAAAIQSVIDVCSTVPSVIQIIEQVFKVNEDSDEHDHIGPSKDWVFLGSIHGIKGLESYRCWWLQHDKVPHKKAKVLQQEINLRWVGGTRSLHDLILVDAKPEMKGRTLDEALN